MSKKKKLENLSNSELELLKKQKRDEFETVRLKIVQVFDYWRSIETEVYNIQEEINKRNRKNIYNV